jgi:oxygen-independent coproporphyrinogen-3 oxidase
MIRELILHLKLGYVHPTYFREKFGVEVGQRFAGPLKELENRGLMTVAADSLRLSRAGLLQVDNLLHEFFLPEHRGARYA